MFLASIWSYSHLRSMFVDRVIHFGGTLWNQEKWSFTDKARFVNWGSQSSLTESTCSKLQYDPYHISVACSYTELSISVRFGRQGKGSFSQKAKNSNRGSLSISSESTRFGIQYDPSLISVACSETELSISEKLWEVRWRVVHRKS